jgi:ligand-binding sensor domain-containing protein/signal transduction histidine kinase
MLQNRWTLALAWLLYGLACSDRLSAAGTFLREGTRYAIDVLDADDGLPQASVIAITQTRDGYLWLGTLNGLVRFDGLRFTVFDEVNTPGLNSGRIFSLFEDSRSNLWIGTEAAGVSVIQDGRVTSLGLAKGRDGRLAAVAEDPSGGLWLYTVNGQLWRWRDGITNRYTVGPSRCRTMIMEDSGLLWVGTDRGLSGLRPTPTLEPVTAPVELSLPVGKLDYLLASQKGGYWRLADGRVQRWTTNHLVWDAGLDSYPWGGAEVSTACEDLEGHLLVGTLGAGVFWFDQDGKATCVSTNQGLSHNLILSLRVDREGTVWVGTDGGGLNRIKRQVFDVLKESLRVTVRSVCEDARGGLWIGFNQYGANLDGGGYLKEGVFEWLGPGQGLTIASVYSVYVDRKQQVWAGTWGGLFRWQENRFQQVAIPNVPLPVVLAIHEDRQGRLWLGTRSGLLRLDEQGWKQYRIRDGLSSEVVWALADDADGNLWIGTEGGGLNRLREGRFTSFRKTARELPGDDIASLYLDEQGVLWIGTDGRGLARFHQGQWTRYTTQDGLISNSIGYLLEDGLGFLWIGSNVGLMRVRKQTLNQFALRQTSTIEGRAYGKPDGLPTRECTLGSQPGACRGRDGKLWFSTIKGLASVNPARLVLNTNPPPVVIESVLIDGQPVHTNRLRAAWPETVIVPAGKEQLEIQFTSLNLAAPDRARFQYWLVGHEKGWVPAGSARFAHYSKLPPGPYHFRVMACNEDGVWNEKGGELWLTVEPPFWRTWWFRAAAAAGLLGAIVAGVHYFSTQRLQRQLGAMRQKEALEKERARIARDIHDQLGASLTQVSLLGELVESDKHSPPDVEMHARQISQTARDTTRSLDEIVWTVNPSNDTLDGLITYVCKYAQDYLAVAGLRYRLDVPADLPPAPISPEVRHNVFLAAKEAVTNVVRHAQASAAWLRLKLEPTAFILEIEDDGRGPVGIDTHAAHTRNGLRNMRKRMEDVGGSFSIGPAPSGGTLVRLRAPLGKA